MLDEFRSTSITWDKATRRIYSPITANESDSNGRKLNIQVVNSGQVENLTGATLHLYWETKDKTQHGLDAFTASDISKGEFELFYTTGMLSNVGELNATLVLVDSTGKVVSDWFKITVTRGINEGAIESENSFSSLTQALIDISNLEKNYAPRLNDLTAQLQQTEQELSSQLAQTQQDSVNIESFGAVKGGVDCTNAINNAIAYAKANGIKYIYRPNGFWYVSTLPKLDAPLEFTGDGQFVLLSNNQVVSFMDRYNDLIFGMEYLQHYHAYLQLSLPSKIVFSGDSTTSNGQFVNHANNYIKQSGVNGVECINNGHSGENTQHWLDGHLDADLALNPNLYVLRWGINDTNADYTVEKVREFETKMRTGLAKIRGLKSVSELSILLMTPNPVGMHYKDKRWGQQINSVLRKLAREYQCTFADTYLYIEDVYNVPSLYDAQLIHPTTVGDRIIVNLISDILVPPTARTYVTNPPAEAHNLKSVDDLPSTYPTGISVFRTTSVGWLFNGIVTTIRQTGSVFLQINSGYDPTKKNQVAFRYGTSATWSEWVTLEGGIAVKPNTTVLLATDPASSFNTGVTLHRASVANGFPAEGMIETTYYYAIAKQVLTTFDGTNTVKVRTWNISGATWNAWKDL